MRVVVITSWFLISLASCDRAPSYGTFEVAPDRAITVMFVRPNPILNSYHRTIQLRVGDGVMARASFTVQDRDDSAIRLFRVAPERFIAVGHTKRFEFRFDTVPVLLRETSPGAVDEPDRMLLGVFGRDRERKWTFIPASEMVDQEP